MADTFKISTTGTFSPVPISDLGRGDLVHPIVDLDLIDAGIPLSEIFMSLKINGSLEIAITSGYIIAKFNNNIVTPSLTTTSDNIAKLGPGKIISPPTLVETVTNDFNPIDIQIAGILNIDVGILDKELTGIKAPPANKFLIIINTSSLSKLKLKHNNVLSLSSNRFFNSKLSDIIHIEKGAMVILFYDFSILRWRPIKS